MNDIHNNPVEQSTTIINKNKGKVDKSKWEYNKLIDVAPISQYKGTIRPKNEKYWLLNLDMIESNSGKILDKVYVQKEEIGSSTITFNKNNVLWSKLRPYLNKVVMPMGEGYATSELIPLRPSKTIDRTFLAYLLRSNWFVKQMNTSAEGARMPRASMKTFRELFIQYPALPEQQAIVLELDTLQSLITQYREQLNDYDKLAQSIFYEMFGDVIVNEKGWETKTIKSLFINRDSERIPISSKKRETKKKIYNYYGAAGVIDKIDKYLFNEPLLLIGEDGANLVTCIKPNAIIARGKYWVNNHAHVLQCKNDIDILYACYCFNLIDISMYITGVAQPKLNQANLNRIVMPLPPLPLQQQFATRIESIEAQKTLIKQQLSDVQTLFDSRMQYYFN